MEKLVLYIMICLGDEDISGLDGSMLRLQLDYIVIELIFKIIDILHYIVI